MSEIFVDRFHLIFCFRLSLLVTLFFGAPQQIEASTPKVDRLEELDQRLMEASPEEITVIRRDRILWREQHCEIGEVSARVAFDHAEDVLMVHLRSGANNAIRRFWTWPLVSAETRKDIHNWVRVFDRWSSAGMAATQQEILDLESDPEFLSDPLLRMQRSEMAMRERDLRGPWLRYLALSHRIHLDLVEDFPIAPRDLRFDEPMSQEAMRREASMWRNRFQNHNQGMDSSGVSYEEPVLSQAAAALLEFHGLVLEQTARTSLGQLDSGLLDEESVASLLPPEQELFHWLSGQFSCQPDAPETCFAWADFTVVKDLSDAPMSKKGLQKSFEAWFKIRNHLRGSGPDWSGLTGQRVARLWSSWQGSLRADLLVQSAPPCGLVAIALSIAPSHPEKSNLLFQRAIQDSMAENADPSAFCRASYVLGVQALRAQDLDQAIPLLRQAAFGAPFGSTPDRRSLPSIPEQWTAVTLLLQTCAAVVEVDSEHVTVELLNALEPMINTAEDQLALAKCFAGFEEYSRALPHFNRVVQEQPDSPEVHAAVFAMERQRVVRADSQARVPVAREVRSRLNDFKSSFLKSRAVKSPTDPKLSGEYRLTEVEVAFALDGPRSARNILNQDPWPTILDGDMLEDRLRVEVRLGSELGEFMSTALSEQLNRAPDRLGPVVAGMLRDRLSSAARAMSLSTPNGDQTSQESALREVLKVFDPWISGQEEPSSAWLELVADSHLLLGDAASGLLAYDRLLIIQSDAAPWLLGQARCQLILAGPDREALVEPMKTFRRLARATSPQKLPNVFWESQLSMLDVLQRIGTPQDELWARVERLRASFPELGGPQFRSAVEAFQKAY